MCCIMCVCVLLSANVYLMCWLCAFSLCLTEIQLWQMCARDYITSIVCVFLHIIVRCKSVVFFVVIFYLVPWAHMRINATYEAMFRTQCTHTHFLYTFVYAKLMWFIMCLNLVNTEFLVRSLFYSRVNSLSLARFGFSVESRKFTLDDAYKITLTHGNFDIKFSMRFSFYIYWYFVMVWKSIMVRDKQRGNTKGKRERERKKKISKM